MDTLDTLAATLPASPESLSQWAAVLLYIMGLCKNPAIIALLANIALLQVVEGLDRFLPEKFHVEGTKELDHRVRFFIAWILTIPMVYAACWLGKLEFRGDNGLFAFMSGPVAAILNTYVLKKVGIDLDKWANGNAATPPAPPAPPAA